MKSFRVTHSDTADLLYSFPFSLNEVHSRGLSLAGCPPSTLEYTEITEQAVLLVLIMYIIKFTKNTSTLGYRAANCEG